MLMHEALVSKARSAIKQIKKKKQFDKNIK